MIELILHMNNYSITGAITAYQIYPKLQFKFPTMYTKYIKRRYTLYQVSVFFFFSHTASGSNSFIPIYTTNNEFQFHFVSG